MKNVILKVKAAIFDLDGTILDSMPMWHRFGANYLSSLGIKAEENLDRKLFHRTSEQSAQYLIDMYQVPKTIPEMLQEMNELCLLYYQNQVPLKEGFWEFLEGLAAKNVKLAVATVSNIDCAVAGLKRNQVFDLFDTVVTVEDVGIGKESPKVFQEAAQRLHVPVRQSYVFEDALHAVLTAKKAGFKTIGVKEPINIYFEDELREVCDFFLESYSEKDRIFKFMGLQ